MDSIEIAFECFLADFPDCGGNADLPEVRAALKGFITDRFKSLVQFDPVERIGVLDELYRKRD